MGGFLSEYDEVVTLKFGKDDEWWCRVKRYLPRGDFRAAQQVLVAPVMRLRTNKDDDEDDQQAETEGAVDSGGYQNELVVRGVVDWNFTDYDGNLLPLAPDDARRRSVDLLPEEVFEAISEVIEAGAPKKAKAADKAFRDEGKARPVRARGSAA